MFTYYGLQEAILWTFSTMFTYYGLQEAILWTFSTMFTYYGLKEAILWTFSTMFTDYGLEEAILWTFSTMFTDYGLKEAILWTFSTMFTDYRLQEGGRRSRRTTRVEGTRNEALTAAVSKATLGKSISDGTKRVWFCHIPAGSKLPRSFVMNFYEKS